MKYECSPLVVILTSTRVVSACIVLVSLQETVTGVLVVETATGFITHDVVAVTLVLLIVSVTDFCKTQTKKHSFFILSLQVEQ